MGKSWSRISGNKIKIGCDPSGKLWGKWADENGDSFEFKNSEVIITLSVLGMTTSTTYKYKADDTTINLYSADDPNSALVVKYTISGDKLTIDGTIFWDGIYTKVKK